MAQGYNRVYLLGMVSDRADLRYTRGGRPVLRLRMGTQEGADDAESDEPPRTDWHELVVVGRRAESLASAVGPGTLLLVEGTLRTRSYQGRDGSKRSATEVLVRALVILAGTARASRPGYGGPRYGTPEHPLDEPVFTDEGQGHLF